MNTVLISIIITAVLVMIVSLIGVIFTNKVLKDWTDKNLKYLVAFASGVFLIVSYNLVGEALEFSEGRILTVLQSIVAGFLIFLGIEKLYPEIHCHHDDKTCLSKSNKRSSRKVLIGDAFHNFGDGILLASVFVIDIRLGFLAAIGIIAHELVQEIAEFFVLKSAGYTNKEALIRNFAISSSVLFGGLFGFYVASFEHLVGPLVGFAAGIFIYILVTDLVPSSFKRSKHDGNYSGYILWAIVGALLVIVSQTVVGFFLEKEGLDSHGHIHEEGEEHDHDHEEEHDHDHEEDEGDYHEDETPELII